MATYVVSLWDKNAPNSPAITYEKATSAAKAVDTLIKRIKWTAEFVYRGMDGYSAGDEVSALNSARGWVPSKATPSITVNLGKYEIIGRKVR